MYFGLSQEDGKSAESTCLDLKIFKFNSSDYSDGVKVTDLPMISSSNFIKKWRYLSFTINEDEFHTRLVLSKNTNHNIYTGYYAIAYYLAETNDVQFSFYFEFSIKILKSSGTALSTNFIPWNIYETDGCSPNQQCSIQPSIFLKWCTDSTCQQDIVPDLYLNDQFIIQQELTQSDQKKFYLTNTMIIPLWIDNSNPGKVTMQLSVDILWTNLALQVTSYLSNTQTDARLLTELDNQFIDIETPSTYDPVTGRTSSIVCIKFQTDNIMCPTCAQECQLNGFSKEWCEPCGENSNNPNFALGIVIACLSILAFSIRSLWMYFNCKQE